MATRGINLDTQHDLLETNRAGPRFWKLGPARSVLSSSFNVVFAVASQFAMDTLA
jgi:hypothetical protein